MANVIDILIGLKGTGQVTNGFRDVENAADRLDSRLKYMEAHLDSRLDRLRADLMKWMFIYWSGTVAAIIGVGYFGPK